MMRRNPERRVVMMMGAEATAQATIVIAYLTSNLGKFSKSKFFRQISTKLKEEGLEPAQLGFAIRLKKIMEENDIREDQLESLILDFNTYRLRHNLTFDKVFESGYEALNLVYKFGIQDSVEKIPEFIIQREKTRN
ncbi:MAG: hypothetical protein ACR2IS_14170 [Nitrososphaeraceae archaeon]